MHTSPQQDIRGIIRSPVTYETSFIINEGHVFVLLLPLDARVHFFLGLELTGELGVCGGQAHIMELVHIVPLTSA